MCQNARCVLVSVSLALGLCFLILYLKKTNNFVPNASLEVNINDETEDKRALGNFFSFEDAGNSKVRGRIHVPKFMLDLYENRKRNNCVLNFSEADVIRSVIPTSAGNNLFLKRAIFEGNLGISLILRHRGQDYIAQSL